MKNNIRLENYVGIDKVADFLGCSPRTVQRAVARGDIPFYRPFGELKFLISEVNTWVKDTKGRKKKKRAQKLPLQYTG